MPKINIERLQDADAEEASKTLALAFQQNPNNTAVFHDTSSQQYVNTFALATKIAKLERKYSVVFVAKVDGKLVGVLNMAPSPHCQFTLVEQLRLTPKIVFTYGRAIFKAMSLVFAFSRNDPKFPHWHIGPIGILPEYQGMGIGSKLIEESIRLVDTQKMSAYLETDTEDNVQLYQKFGFKTIKTIQVLNNTNWLMLREPQ